MNGKKLLALLLTVFMVIGMLPVSVFAAETETQTQTEQTGAAAHVEPQLTSDAVVYVSNDAGDDSYEGLTPDEPVYTLTRAAEILGENGGTIVICGTVEIANEPLDTYEYTVDDVTATYADGRFRMPAHDGLIYITSTYDGVDYLADNSAALYLSNWFDHGHEKATHFVLGGPTTFENLHFACTTNPVFYGRGHFITMGEGITQDYNLLVVGYDQGTVFTKGEVRSTDVDTHMILKSGSYHTVVGMNRQTIDGTYIGDAYITVEPGVTRIGTFAGLASGCVGGYYGNSYITINGGAFPGVFTGGAHDCKGGNYGNATIVINDGNFAGGRVDGLARGGSYNVFGDVDMTINAGTFNTVEGYCFGTANSVFGNSDLTINGGSYAFINGVLMNDASVKESNCKVASATTTFNGGTLSNYICGGSYRTNFTAQDVTLNLNNDIAYPNTVPGLNMTGNATVTGSVTVNMSAGTIKSTAYLTVLSYGYKTSDTNKTETKVLGTPDVYFNMTGGSVPNTAGGLFLVMSTDVQLTDKGRQFDVGRVYYNISGGEIAKMYVGARQGKAIGSSGMYFTYSGGNIGEVSTAWLTNYQKYYFVGDKTYETSKITGGGQAGYPKLGDNAFNYVNIGSEYPDAVYLRPEADGGDYVNDGLTPETPVQSIYDAAATLGPNGGTIYMMGDTPGCYTPVIDGTLTFSTILPGETEPNGYGFNLNAGNLYLESNAVFDGVTFKSSTAERLIAFQGHDVTVNENCRMLLTNEDAGTSGSVSLIMGYSQTADAYYDGGKNAAQVSVYRDQTVNINGGEWISFTGGNKRFGQSASIGTYYGDVTINIGEGATFTNNTPADDTYPVNAVHLTGANIIKGNVTANLAGTFNTPVYGVGRLGVYFNGVRVTLDGTEYHYLGTDGIGMTDDTKFEGNITVNATGNFTLENGLIDAICRAGDTPLYGNFTLNTEGGTFADGFKTDAKGVMGTATYTGDADVKAVNYDTVNGAENKSTDPIRVITVGDSITWGTCATASEVDGYSYHLYNNNYPAQLAKLLGEGAVVGNFGYPGAHAFYSVFNDYFGSSSYGLSMQFGDADAVIIAIGTNDNANVATDGVINEEGAGYYLDSMRRLIENYHAAYPNATIYITTALPRWSGEVSTANTENVVIPLQEQLAGEYEYTKLMDLYADMLPYAEIDKTNGTSLYFHTDKLHPNNGGYAVMGAAVAEDIKADFHYYTHELREATCTEIGCDHYACIWCNESYNENETEALGHNFIETGRQDATHEAEGYVDYECDRCGATTRETLPILGKTYTETEVFAPTCTEQGYTRHYCDQDDSYYDDTFVDALGHDPVTSTVAPKCTEEGKIITTCTRCDHYEEEAIEALGHTEGDAATCTKDQICTVCGEVLVSALGHDNTVTVVDPTATTAGYTHTVCSRGDVNTKTDWVDATEKIVVFVDANAEAGGDGTIDAPFKTYTDACLYADTSFDRTIVLMSVINHSTHYTERAHTGHYTVTGSYGEVDYGGGFNFKGGYHYILNGDTTFENFSFTLASTLVIRCKFNALVMGEGIAVTEGKNMYIVGADQDSKSTADASQDVNITLLSGKYFEVIGGYRSGGSSDITGTINIYVGGTAEIDKLFIGNRGFTSKAIKDANVTIDGGIINVFVAASDVQGTTAATGAAKGTIVVNVTENFDISQSFNGDAGVSFAGISLSTAIKGHEEAVLATSGTYILNINAENYWNVMDSGKVNEISINTINCIGELAEGDFDHDGELTNADVTILVRYLAGWDVDGVVDVTADEKINNRDALYLVQKLAGWFEE